MQRIEASWPFEIRLVLSFLQCTNVEAVFTSPLSAPYNLALSFHLAPPSTTSNSLPSLHPVHSSNTLTPPSPGAKQVPAYPSPSTPSPWPCLAPSAPLTTPSNGVAVKPTNGLMSPSL